MAERPPTIAEIERYVRSGTLSRRQLIAALAGMGFTAGGLAGLLGTDIPTAWSADAAARYLVLIVLDAFRPDYMRLAPMPALTALMREGATYDRAWVGQLESYTPTGHASLSTGALPRRDGVIGFEWRDPVTNTELLDAWPDQTVAGRLEKDLKASGTASIPAAIKAADPAAVVVSLSSEKVYAADAMGGPAADYILYHWRPSAGPRALLPTAMAGHTPPPSFFDHPMLTARWPLSHFTDWDWLSGMLALTAFEVFRPRALLINLPGADAYGHPYGGPATPTLMARVVAGLDRNIARVVAAYKSAGIYDQTLFVVTADHGMVPNTQTVDGTATRAAVKSAGGKYFFHTGGTAADIYLHNPSRARAVSAAMRQLHGVAAAYSHQRSGSAFEYVPAPGQSLAPDLDAAYRYLLSTFDGAAAPDVVAPFHENTIGRAYDRAYGDHGGLSWGTQHIPLVLRGPGVKNGAQSHYPARLIDVAPTVLRLLGLPPAAMDGAVLADALLDPTAAEISSQAANASDLTSHQNALMEQSTRDIRWYRKNRIEAPPSATPQP
jgi:arylsulfatase A-like enzyme